MNSNNTGESRESCEEDCRKEGVIRCIFLSEFHPVVGSKISCQVPNGYISKETFDAINVYIIPKPQLQRCILTVNVLDVKIVGYPVRIDSQKYARNAYHFNLCFVCDAWTRSVQYESVVKKLSEYLIMMEDETGFLSKDDDEKISLQRLFEKIINDLNEKRVTTVIEGENTIYLKLVTRQPDPPIVKDHMVPLLVSEYKDIPLELWDLTTQQILPFINGTNHISKLSAKADVETNLVKTCIRNLVFYGIVKLLPILKYSNVYMCTHGLQKLTKDPGIYQACRKYICLNSDKPKPTLQKIFQFYASMTHGITLKTICQRLCPQNNNIDEKKLVIFGLQYNFIRCIHKYPIFTGNKPDNDRQELYTGIYNFDELCCETNVSPHSIENDIDSDSSVRAIWK